MRRGDGGERWVQKKYERRQETLRILVGGEGVKERDEGMRNDVIGRVESLEASRGVPRVASSLFLTKFSFLFLWTPSSLEKVRFFSYFPIYIYTTVDRIFFSFTSMLYIIKDHVSFS